jgi:hypothetical protein
MAKSINRHFHFLASSKDSKPSGRLWYPSADVYQTPEGWLVKVELAGVSAEDLEIDIQGINFISPGVGATRPARSVCHTSKWRLLTAVLKKLWNFLHPLRVRSSNIIIRTGFY